jgi:pimeloyl-ACP methyl ester carboxylesterase
VIERRELLIPVDGAGALAATTIIDPDLAGERPVVLCCFAGGGMTSRYFELDGFDMASYLAEAGFVLALFDHPAIANSHFHNDPWLLSPETVAALEVSAVQRLIAGLGYQHCTVIGVGHSMGAMLAAYQQHGASQRDRVSLRNSDRLYAGLVLLGYSGRGMPEVLGPDERAVADDPDRVREMVATLARRRFQMPLVTGSRGAGQMMTGPEPLPGAVAALAKASAPLLAVCGMATLLPGAHVLPLAAVDVPVLLAVGEHDITGPAAELPGYFPAGADVQVDVVPDAYHNSNVAPTRCVLWDRLARWARTVAGPERAGITP